MYRTTVRHLLLIVCTAQIAICFPCYSDRPWYSPARIHDRIFFGTGSHATSFASRLEKFEDDPRNENFPGRYTGFQLRLAAMMRVAFVTVPSVFVGTTLGCAFFMSGRADELRAVGFASLVAGVLIGPKFFRNGTSGIRFAEGHVITDLAMHFRPTKPGVVWQLIFGTTSDQWNDHQNTYQIAGRGKYHLLDLLIDDLLEKKIFHKGPTTKLEIHLPNFEGNPRVISLVATQNIHAFPSIQLPRGISAENVSELTESIWEKAMPEWDDDKKE